MWWAELCPIALQSIHSLIAGPLESYLMFTLHGRKVWVDAIKLMILRWGGYSLGPKSNHKPPDRRGGRRRFDFREKRRHYEHRGGGIGCDAGTALEPPEEVWPNCTLILAQ